MVNTIYRTSIITKLMLIILLWSNLTIASNSKTPKILLQYSVSLIEFQNKNIVSINYKNIPHWHTYWKNPGDAGLPLSNKIELNGSEISAIEYEWPTPKRYIEPGNMWAYGYEGEYSLFYEVPKSLEGTLEVESTWLICKDICIPGKANFTATIRNNSLTSSKLSSTQATLLKVSKSDLIKRLENLPKEIPFPNEEIDLVLAKNNSKSEFLSLYYNLNSTETNYDSSTNLLIPFPNKYLDFKHEEIYRDKKNLIYARMSAEWDGLYLEPEVPFPSDGKLPGNFSLKFLYRMQSTGKDVVVTKEFNNFLIKGADNLQNFLELLTPMTEPEKSQVNTHSKGSTWEQMQSLLWALILAFIGGIILNLMPCVLPVISIKLFSLIKQSEQNKSEIFKHNLLYTLGVLSSFFVLGIFVILLKSSGEAIGWGFQLQSPTFIAVITLALFTFSLNLFGLYEFVTPGGNLLGSVKTSGGLGDFLNGVFATVLATPCTAPFMGTALAFAFTSGPLIIMLTFLFIGLGLSFPFILTAFFPSLVHSLPRPGNWMNRLKQMLGITLLLTIIWLLTIFHTLSNDTSLLLFVFASYLLIFMGIFLYQKLQRKKMLLVSFSILSLGVLIPIYQTGPIDQSNISTNNKNILKAGIRWEKWSASKTGELKKNKTPTFIDFTADWCLTCKVNEKVVISSKDFQAVMKKNNVTMLLADWTKGDPEITNWLQNHNMAGVPAYFIINKKGELINLGETISVKEVEEAL